MRGVVWAAVSSQLVGIVVSAIRVCGLDCFFFS